MILSFNTIPNHLQGPLGSFSVPKCQFYALAMFLRPNVLSGANVNCTVLAFFVEDFGISELLCAFSTDLV